MASFDWNQARAFWATAEHGSLSAAARVLGLSQPTLSRQVAGLEDDLGVLLFERIGRTLSLTEAGQDLREHVRAMSVAAEQVALTASGQSQSIEGRVSITASDVMAAFTLPQCLHEIRRQAPGITLEVVAADDIRDLRRREADIAIRHVRPEHPDLIAKLIGDMTAQFYATPAYLEKIGPPQSVADLARAEFISYGQPSAMMSRIVPLFDLPLKEENFPYITENGVAGWEMAKAGLGIAIMASELGDRTPEVVPVLPDRPPVVKFPIWLVVHREVRSSRRIRLVFDILGDFLRASMHPERKKKTPRG
ncbi:MAG: LysR family transcriptional regulator [Paracoccaceae bacterium]